MIFIIVLFYLLFGASNILAIPTPKDSPLKKLLFKNGHREELPHLQNYMNSPFPKRLKRSEHTASMSSENNDDLSLKANIHFLPEENAQSSDNFTGLTVALTNNSMALIQQSLLEPLTVALDILIWTPLVHLSLPVLIGAVLARTVLAIINGIINYVIAEENSTELVQSFSQFFRTDLIDKQ